MPWSARTSFLVSTIVYVLCIFKVARRWAWQMCLPYFPCCHNQSSGNLQGTWISSKPSKKEEMCIISHSIRECCCRWGWWRRWKNQNAAGNRLTKELEWLQVEKFGLQRFAGSDSDIWSYTGFPDYNTLTSFYEFLGPAVTQLNYWGFDSSEKRPPEIEKQGPSRKLKPINELFLVLYRLHCNVLEKDLGDWFGLHPSSVSRILTTWLNFLYHTLKQIPIWASREVVTKTMPACFVAHYPQTHVIIDCT